MKDTTEKTNKREVDVFLTAENFEDTMNGLKGVYFRLYTKESDKPDGVRNENKVDFFYRNYKNMVEIKRSYDHEDYFAMDDAIKKYNPELREMVALELSQYATLDNRNLDISVDSIDDTEYMY